VFFGAVGTGIALLERGVDAPIALLSGQLSAFALVILFERIFPYHESWNHSQGDLLTDVFHLLGTTLTSSVLVPLLLTLVLIQLAGGPSLGWWPEAWPLAAQLALAMVVGEFFQYWVHRLQHETDLLWRIHAVHHSAPRLYWLNAARFHPLDIALNSLAAFIPLRLMGIGPEVVALHGLFSAVHGIFQHSNLVLRLGPLNWLFSMAELHRWHHSRRLEEANHNYGQNLIVWDVLFGTRFLPADREPPQEIGIEAMPHFPARYAAHLASPFRWQRLLRESR
jgi:sterol desaturase/sphingolipid hydroxylase (fatty acid hydroxylase superfamily)